MSELFDYPPEHFADVSPEEILNGNYWFTLSEVMKATGLDLDELRKELASGRVNAHGTPTSFGYKNVLIHASELFELMKRLGKI